MEIGATVPGRFEAPIAKIGVAAILVLQAGIGLYLGLPGQLSPDSIVQLYEGRTLHFISFNPPLMSILLGALDRIGDAPVLFVLLSQALLSASSWLVLSRAERPTAPRLVLAGIALLNPVVLIYVGIVWKDVLLAHAVVLLYLVLARLRRQGRTMTLPIALLVVALLTVVIGARQQGVLFALPAALWAATLATPSKRLRLLAGIAFLAIPFAANQWVDAYAAHSRAPVQPSPASIGWRILTLYDIAGILANGGAPPVGTAPALAAELEEQSRYYSPYRVDDLPGPSREFWAMSNAQMMRFWGVTIMANPQAYLRHRVLHFSALLGLADMHRCAPVFSGIAGPVVHSRVEGDLDALLGLAAGPHAVTDSVNRYGWEYADTPLFSHLAYAGLLVLICLWLARRGEYVLLTLAGCALLFLASYSVFGIACDFRYAYTLTVTTTLLAAFACVTAGPARDIPGPGRGTIRG